MQVLSPFDRLIATEAAVRLEFVRRCQEVKTGGKTSTTSFKLLVLK